ncbi:MAG: hypothetical protein DHS20C12_09530 [Pseudohongiella sp.]|nr:MAG: hypothetical protein DHS20C12_09530 [Pseudohongiella sp.]
MELRARWKLLLIAIGFVLLSSTSQAQPPYIDGNLLVVPAVEIGAEKYRVELIVDASTAPVSLNLHFAEAVENVSSYQASTLVGSTLTIPRLSYDGRSYELTMNLSSENPVIFQLSSVVELSENFPATTQTTYAPNVCSADVALLREESFNVQDHSEGYKGNIFAGRQIEVSDSSFKKNAVISLITDEVLIVAEQHPDGFPEGATYRFFSELTVAPDFGDQNDPDYPVAFVASILIDSLNRESALLRSDGRGALDQVLLTGATLNLGEVSGVVESFYDLRAGVEDALFFFVRFEDNDNEYLVKQARPGGSYSLLLSQGSYLNTGDSTTVRSVGDIELVRPNVFDQAIVKVEVLDENESVEGFAYLAVDDFTGSHQCLATDSSILCGGALITDGIQLLDFSSDGATIGATISDGSGSALDYKVIANPIVERISRNVPFQGFNFFGFKQPKVCESRNALYFVGQFHDTSVGIYDELMRIDENGNIKQLTDFRSLLADASLEGTVPDEVRRWAIGYNCDAALFMHGPSAPDSFQGYEGNWASYLSGETMKIMDSTLKDANGTIYEASPATTGIDFSTDSTTVVSTGPNGEFYAIPKIENSEGTFVTTYTVATKPQSCP